jgi:hypothetical protein
MSSSHSLRALGSFSFSLAALDLAVRAKVAAAEDEEREVEIVAFDTEAEAEAAMDMDEEQGRPCVSCVVREELPSRSLLLPLPLLLLGLFDSQCLPLLLPSRQSRS